MKKKLLIICRQQFGYHIDSYYYCKMASQSFDITYICLDGDREKIEIDDVAVKYISRKGNIILRYLRLFFTLFMECFKRYDVIFVRFFVGCSLLRVFHPFKRFVLDVRTGSVNQNFVNRCRDDFLLRLESVYFKHISVISKSLAKKLKLPSRKVHILPLGAEPVGSSLDKKFDSLHLLYTGTLDYRNMEDTIRGFAQFHSEFADSITMTYDIIGDSYHGKLAHLRTMVDDLGLSEVIKLPGYIHISRLAPYYDKCNVGISYVPINNIYDCQPPTKTFEYVFAGIPVIATATYENKRIVNQTNGILIEDNYLSFDEGLKDFYLRRKEFSSYEIKKSCEANSWDKIINDNFVPYINSAMGRGIS